MPADPKTESDFQQKPPTRRVLIESEHCYATPNFQIAADLVGGTMSFRYEGSDVDICLPSTMPDCDFSDGPLMFSRQTTLNGERVAVALHVRRVLTRVSIPGEHEISVDMLDSAAIDNEFLLPGQEKELRAFAENARSIAEGAFEMWARTTRWVIGYERTLREASAPTVLSNDHVISLGSRIQEVETKSGIYLWHPDMHLAVGGPYLTTDQWKICERLIDKNLGSPIFVDLLFDATHNLSKGDIRRALIDCAVAAETLIRTVVQESLPATLDQAPRSLIDESSIQAVIRKLFAGALQATGQSAPPKQTMSALHALFDRRNQILHSGNMSGITREECQRYLTAVREVIGSKLTCTS